MDPPCVWLLISGSLPKAKQQNNRFPLKPNKTRVPKTSKAYNAHQIHILTHSQIMLNYASTALQHQLKTYQHILQNPPQPPIFPSEKTSPSASWPIRFRRDCVTRLGFPAAAVPPHGSRRSPPAPPRSRRPRNTFPSTSTSRILEVAGLHSVYPCKKGSAQIREPWPIRLRATKRSAIDPATHRASGGSAPLLVLFFC